MVSLKRRCYHEHPINASHSFARFNSSGFKVIWDTIVDLPAIWDGIVAIFTPIGEWFSERWNDITTVLADVAKWFGRPSKKAWDALTKVFSPIGTWFGER